MEIKKYGTLRDVNFAIVTVIMIVICAGLAAMVVITTKAAGQADETTCQYLYRLAWLATALLSLGVIALVWTIVHRLAQRLGDKQKTPPSSDPKVNAWTIAGQRLKLDEDSDGENQ